jgi:hypothetical protein
MKSTRNNSSDNYIPGSCEELARLKWTREQKQRDRREAWDTLNAYVHSKGAWIVSLPGDNRDVVMEVLENSELPADLIRRGYELEPADPPSGERILPTARTEHILIENSTKSTIVVTHAGVVRVLRYVFQL